MWSLSSLQAKFGLTQMAPQRQQTRPQVNRPSSVMLGISKMASKGRPTRQPAKGPSSSKKQAMEGPVLIAPRHRSKIQYDGSTEAVISMYDDTLCSRCQSIHTIYKEHRRKPGGMWTEHPTPCPRDMHKKTITPPSASEWPTAKRDDQFILGI